MPVVNATIAAIFDEIADLLDIQGANPFRIRAYRNAARTTGGLAHDIKSIAADAGKLKELPGIGDDLAAKIQEIVATGKCEFLERLRKQVPPAVAELLRIPGLGPKRVRMLYQELEVQTLDQLLRAARDGRVRELPGFGAKTAQNLREGIDRAHECMVAFGSPSGWLALFWAIVDYGLPYAAARVAEHVPREAEIMLGREALEGMDRFGLAPSRLAGMMGARGGFYEAATLRVAPDASVTAYLGTHNHGQGHSTTFAQILAARFSIPMERVCVVEGDTSAVPVGTGTFGSRSMAVGGSALHAAAEKIVAKGKKIAAHLLEAAPADIVCEGGTLTVKGMPSRGIGWAEVAAAAHAGSIPGEAPGLEDMQVFSVSQSAYANGTHAVVVEVDLESPADLVGLEPGDVIREIDRKPIGSITDFQTAMRRIEGARDVLVLVQRAEVAVYVIVWTRPDP